MNEIVEFYNHSTAMAATGILSWIGVLMCFFGACSLLYVTRTFPYLLICVGTIPFILEPGMADVFTLAWSQYDSDGNLIAEVSYPNFPWIYAFIKAVGIFLLGSGILILGLQSIAYNHSLNSTPKDGAN
ncbi:MAG: hypothetical protein AB2826_19910 [Candidatus Thiodiazotropha sp.]